MNIQPIARPLPLGRVVATPGVTSGVCPDCALRSLGQHRHHNWGEVCEGDRETNERAVQNGDRVMSVWHDGDTKFWIITEADRSVTTILLPEEY